MKQLDTDVMKVGTVGGVVATLALMVPSLILYYLHVIPVSITEYAARFILSGLESVDFGRPSIWFVGIAANMGIGGFFGLISALVYGLTEFQHPISKVLLIAYLEWFFQLAIVPFLSPRMHQLSTVRVAVAFFFLYIFWSSVMFWWSRNALSDHS